MHSECRLEELMLTSFVWGLGLTTRAVFGKREPEVHFSHFHCVSPFVTSFHCLSLLSLLTLLAHHTQLRPPPASSKAPPISACPITL